MFGGDDHIGLAVNLVSSAPRSLVMDSGFVRGERSFAISESVPCLLEPDAEISVFAPNKRCIKPTNAE